jgi:hypothetical protein
MPRSLRPSAINPHQNAHPAFSAWKAISAPKLLTDLTQKSTITVQMRQKLSAGKSDSVPFWPPKPQAA